MARLRRALGSLAIAWLFCQAATMGVAPVVFWYGAADADLPECTCSHGEHAVCPMHHKPAVDLGLCLMRGVDNTGAAVLSWLLNGAGLVPAAVHTAAPNAGPSPVLGDITTSSLRPAPPDPPPPRV